MCRCVYGVLCVHIYLYYSTGGWLYGLYSTKEVCMYEVTKNEARGDREHSTHSDKQNPRA